MKLNRYFFTKKDGKEERIILNPEKGMNVSGIVTGRPGFPDGSMITTSTVEEIKGNSIVTYSGSEYELGDQHPDFVELQKALEEGTPVLTEWDLLEDLVIGKNFLTGEEFRGVVISQDGNYVTLMDSKGIEEKYFVIWRNTSQRVRKMLTYFGELGGRKYNRRSEDFRDQFSFKCVPILT